MDNIRIVFDIDDTISSNIRRLSYDKCVPDFDVINKINYLHDELGFYIILHTARGMVSCNGDVEKAINKNKKVLEDWLKKYNVKYDEIIFGKPIADLYVDDKALDVSDFKKEKFELLQGGGSKRPLYHIGKIVKKFVGSEKDTNNFKDWIEDNNNSCKFPKVISYLYNAVYIEYIEGENLVECFNAIDLVNVIKVIDDFSKMKKDSFDINIQINILEKNYSNDYEVNEMIDKCIKFLNKNERKLIENASYSHGDMILSNIIKSKNDELYFIDSRYFRESSSYLLDFAKLRMSLGGYESFFNISNKSYAKYLCYLDLILKEKDIYDIVIGLELMYILRLYRYKNEEDKVIVKNFAKGIILRHEELFK